MVDLVVIPGMGFLNRSPTGWVGQTGGEKGHFSPVFFYVESWLNKKTHQCLKGNPKNGMKSRDHSG